MNTLVSSVFSMLFASFLLGSSANAQATPILSEGNNHIISSTVITKVEGDGQKVAAVAIQYDNNIDSSSLSTDDFIIDGYSITGIYTNAEASLATENTEGSYVNLLVSTDYINSNYKAEMDGTRAGNEEGGNNRPESLDEASIQSKTTLSTEGNDSRSGSTFSMDSTLSNQFTVAFIQAGEIQTVSGDVYSSFTDEITTNYEANLNLVVDEFEQLVYTDPEDSVNTLMYNLFVPEGDGEDTSYPIVLFMPDATATGNDPVKTLTQGLGAIVWAEAENQKEYPIFVLAPQYTSDGSKDIENTIALLKQVMQEYNIDSNRVYVTGQSAGTIKAIQMMIENPDLFAAAMLVAGQADDAYTNRLAELKDQNIWMIASTSDERALPGMTAIMEAVEAEGIEVTVGTWSASLPESEQNKEAEAMANNGTSINFTVLSDVVPEGVLSSAVTEHLNTWRVAYSVSSIRQWIFQQSK